VVEVFSNPAYVGFYLVTLSVIGFHLWYGFESALESLGLNYHIAARRFGQLLAVVLTGGFILIPVVVYVMGGGL
jgi:succinate dehydrogenase / fumarate reductase cytochrome b subunit